MVEIDYPPTGVRTVTAGDLVFAAGQQGQRRHGYRVLTTQPLEFLGQPQPAQRRDQRGKQSPDR